MDNIFELKTGRLVFESDKIVITDTAKFLKRGRLFSSAILILLGFYNVLTYMKLGDIHKSGSGMVIGLAGLLFLVLAILTNTQNEISMQEVKSLKVKRVLFKEFLIIKLLNNQTRRVNGIYNAERLEEYIKTLPLSNQFV